MNPSPSFKVYSTLGQPLAQVQVILNSAYASDEVTSFPNDVFPDLRNLGSQTTDGAGLVTFDEFQVFIKRIFFLYFF